MIAQVSLIQQKKLEGGHKFVFSKYQTQNAKMVTLLILLKEKEREIAQSCLTLCNPMDCS